MPDRSKDMGQTKCIPWSSRFGVGCGSKEPTPENLLLRSHGGDQDPHRVVAPVRKKKIGSIFLYYRTFSGIQFDPLANFNVPPLIPCVLRFLMSYFELSKLFFGSLFIYYSTY
jgi:hypothetical protein